MNNNDEKENFQAELGKGKHSRQDSTNWDWKGGSKEYKLCKGVLGSKAHLKSKPGDKATQKSKYESIISGLIRDPEFVGFTLAWSTVQSKFKKIFEDFMKAHGLGPDAERHNKSANPNYDDLSPTNQILFECFRDGQQAGDEKETKKEALKEKKYVMDGVTDVLKSGKISSGLANFAAQVQITKHTPSVVSTFKGSFGKVSANASDCESVSDTKENFRGNKRKVSDDHQLDSDCMMLMKKITAESKAEEESGSSRELIDAIKASTAASQRSSEMTLQAILALTQSLSRNNNNNN